MGACDQLFFQLRSKGRLEKAFLAVNRGKPSCKIMIANGTTSSGRKSSNSKDMKVALEGGLSGISILSH